MRLFSYVVARDYGFAPNPFHGVCTLATCKPKIREHASIGDYIVGTGCAGRERTGYLVYFMCVDEITTYNNYWIDPRFQSKRPNLRGSKMQAFGDNIYHIDPITGDWCQANSHHSLRNGRPNPINSNHDTQCSKVLIGRKFSYWGGEGPMIPTRFRDYDGIDVCCGRGYRNHFTDQIVQDFTEWLHDLDQCGFSGTPIDWDRTL